MILELIITPIFMLLEGLIGMLPSMPDMPDWISYTIDIIGMGLYIFPAPVWVACIASVSFWSFGQIGWRMIEWIYRKIPGVS